MLEVQYILVCNPEESSEIDAMHFYGPFLTLEEARAYANEHVPEALLPWHAVPVIKGKDD